MNICDLSSVLYCYSLIDYSISIHQVFFLVRPSCAYTTDVKRVVFAFLVFNVQFKLNVLRP